MSLKLKLEERLNELRQALAESEAQTWAIRGAIQEVESYILPLIEDADAAEAANEVIDVE